MQLARLVNVTAIVKNAEKVKTITSMLRSQPQNHPYCEILFSSPYLAEIVAATIIGIIKNIDNWPNKKTFKKALGVYSISLQPAGQYRTKQEEEGSRHGRRMLFQVCLGCITSRTLENDFKDYYKQVVCGKPKMKALVST
ncbi:MAG: hypothetical protein DRP74_09235 [Candidatus Omnitrophota bacterium]|nr:MAG: hypothetical protein DRP74_09235 [Candidatus Omnitrophota bacterium]